MLTSSGNSYLRTLTKAWFRAGWVAALVTTVSFGCARSVDPINGSETHFLEGCNMTCSSGLECVDGQCSKLCSTDDTCTHLDPAATCENQPSGVRACEVGCSDEADCTQLRPELSCNAGVCRGPLWHIEVGNDPDGSSDGDSSEGDASNDQVSDTSDANAPVGSTPDACDEPACPPNEAMYFTLPEEGLGTVRLEFMFNLGEVPYTRCAVEFVDDELVNSSCESNEVAAAVLENTCPAPVGCSSGGLRFDVHPVDFEVTYWQNGYQVLPLDTTTWEDATFSVGPEGCQVSCNLTYLSRQLPSTKGLNACLNPEHECGFGLGCGDRASALANAPACSAENEAVLAGEGCGYDVLIYQQYIESARAFYDKDTGKFVGYWHKSDTFAVDCQGLVPFDCTEVVEAVDICGTSDAGAPDGGTLDADTE